MPDSKVAGAIPKRMEFSRLQHEVRWPITFGARSPLTMAADICGIEQFAKWLIRKPQLCDKLMRIALEYTLKVLQYWVDTFGSNEIVYCMSSPTESNQIFSPRDVKKYAIPYHRELHERIQAIGINKFMFHVCGEQNLNLPHLAEFAASEDSWIHPSILSFGPEVNLDTAACYFPNDIIMGNIEPALFQTGTPEQIYHQCRICIEQGKNFRGGFILGPGCGLPPKAPPYNVYMMRKAVDDFGWY
jgi:uroporphyrinogen decarboxylase